MTRMAGHFLKVILPFTLLFLAFSGLGGFLVYDSIRDLGPLAVPEVIAGAMLITLSLITVHPQVRLALRWREAARAEHNRNA